MKMYHLPFGDWSGDGHKDYRVVLVKCEDPNTFRDAEDKIKRKYGKYFFTHMADEYDNAIVGEEIWKALIADTNYSVEDFLKTIDGYYVSGINTLDDVYNNFKNEPMNIEVVIEMYFHLVRAFGAKFEVVTPGIEMITNVAAPGYGCLGD
jgi:hypothetical protein